MHSPTPRIGSSPRPDAWSRRRYSPPPRPPSNPMPPPPRAEGARAPLAGVRTLTASQFGAGPFGTTVLADLGAEVIKIEDPSGGGDVARYVPPYTADQDSLYFQSFNRGKKSLALDLRHPDGQSVLHDLVRVSDAVFNNVRGDQPKRLGLTSRQP